VHRRRERGRLEAKLQDDGVGRAGGGGGGSLVARVG
jgi:hypothetical protein